MRVGNSETFARAILVRAGSDRGEEKPASPLFAPAEVLRYGYHAVAVIVAVTGLEIDRCLQFPEEDYYNPDKEPAYERSPKFRFELEPRRDKILRGWPLIL